MAVPPLDLDGAAPLLLVLAAAVVVFIAGALASVAPVSDLPPALVELPQPAPTSTIAAVIADTASRRRWHPLPTE